MILNGAGVGRQKDVQEERRAVKGSRGRVREKRDWMWAKISA